MAKAEKPFKIEADLCARFISSLKEGWTPYAETAGWDILLVRDADGFQIGIQAKLRLNVKVLNQAIEDGNQWSAERAGPDCRAIMVPDGEGGGLGAIAAYIGITVIRVRAKDQWGMPAFEPGLPRIGNEWSERYWFEMAPVKRHKLPEYIPDVAAGASAPVQLTAWKISAIKIAVTLERRGFVTRSDFKQHGIDYRRWIAPKYGWLSVSDGRYTAGPRLPDFKIQHPKVYAEIAAGADEWIGTEKRLV